MYMSSPVAGDGLIYGHVGQEKGPLRRARRADRRREMGDRRTGRGLRVRAPTPQHVIFLTNGADLVVVKRGGTYAPEKKYDLGASETWAAPALVGRDL